MCIILRYLIAVLLNLQQLSMNFKKFNAYIYKNQDIQVALYVNKQLSEP